MLWVNGHYNYIPPYSAVIDFSRQNWLSIEVQILSTKVDPRAVRLKKVPSLVCSCKQKC